MIAASPYEHLLSDPRLQRIPDQSGGDLVDGHPRLQEPPLLLPRLRLDEVLEELALLLDFRTFTGNNSVMF